MRGFRRLGLAALCVLAVSAFMISVAGAGTPSEQIITTPTGKILVFTNSAVTAGSKDTTAAIEVGGTKFPAPDFTMLAHQTVASSVIFLPATIYAVGGGDSVQYGIQMSMDGTNWIAHTALASVIEPTAFISKVISGQPRYVRFIIGNDLSSAGSAACKFYFAYPVRSGGGAPQVAH